MLGLIQLFPSILRAQSQVEAPTKVSLAKGAVAPFTGTLLNTSALALILVDSDTKLKLAQLEIDKLKKELELEKQKAEAVCSAKLLGEQLKYSACSKESDRLNSIIKTSAEQPWYKAPYLHFILGSVVSGGICAATIRVK